MLKKQELKKENLKPIKVIQTKRKKNMKCHYAKIRKRTTINCGTKQKTDQSYKKMCDINSIVKNYQKTGILSHQRENLGRYIDNTKIPSLMDAQELLRHAKESFLALPSDIRKLMDHDPTKLVEFIQNPKNKQMLLDYGILEAKAVEIPKEIQEQPKAEPAVAKTQEE